MRETRQRGTSVALSSVVCLLSFAFMGCFITTDIDVPEPPLCPPVIQSLAVNGMPADLGGVIRINPNSSSMTTFRVGIRDCNQQQTIQTIVLLDWNGEPGDSFFDAFVRSDPNVPRLTDDPELAEYEFPVLHVNLTDDQCQKLQLRLSSAFVQFDSRPVIEGDLGEATWWLMVDSDLSSAVPLSECQ